MKIELKQILIDRPFALNDESKLSSILQDYYGKDKYKANLLMFGYKNGLVSALLAGADKAQTYNKYKYELEQNYRCSSTDAEHIVKTWIDCIDDEIIAISGVLLSPRALSIEAHILYAMLVTSPPKIM